MTPYERPRSVEAWQEWIDGFPAAITIQRLAPDDDPADLEEDSEDRTMVHAAFLSLVSGEDMTRPVLEAPLLDLDYSMSIPVGTIERATETRWVVKGPKGDDRRWVLDSNAPDIFNREAEAAREEASA